MGTLGIDGLISGLDTTSLITSLMQAEAAPQTSLKATLSTTQKSVTALQSINTKMAALATAAAKLARPETWTATAATVSSDAVTATTSTSALTGTLTFDVKNLATAQSVVSSNTFALTDQKMSGYPIEVRDAKGNVTASVTPIDGSLTSVVSAINAVANSGVRAAAVQVSPGLYRLQVTSTTTGSSGAFTLSGLTGAGTLDPLTPAQDALIHVGPTGAGYDVTSPTNTVTDLLPGLTMRLQKPADGVTVDLRTDPASTADAVQAMVDAANAVLSEIGGQSSTGVTNADGTRSGAGPLAGDSLLRRLAGDLIDTVATGVGGASAATFGLATTRDGRLTLDRSVLLDQLAKDPSAVQAMLSPTAAGADGVGVRLAAVAKNATDIVSGSLTSAVNARTGTISDLNDRISDWDVRLADRRATLQKTYSALEVTLSGLKNQSSWLSGQIAGLG
jgi:flagellar hook-associated protein 2